MSGATILAVAVHPGKADSMHVRDVPRPSVDAIPGGRGVLVKMIRVGLCGTDREIDAAEFGEAPAGDDFLIIGHENLGRIEAVGPNVPSTLKPGGLVVATVRRPGSTIYDLIGLQDMTTGEDFTERGIRRAHGYLAESYAEDAAYLVALPESLEKAGVLLEPLSIVEKGIRQAYEIQRRLHVWQPARAAVLGAGPVGLLAALALRLRGIEVEVLSRRAAPYLNSDLVEAIGGALREHEHDDARGGVGEGRPVRHHPRRDRLQPARIRRGRDPRAGRRPGPRQRHRRRPDVRGAGRPDQPGLRPRQQGHGRHGQRPSRTTSPRASRTCSVPRRSSRAGSSGC